MQYFSMFSGIGGIENGIERAYIHRSNRDTTTKEKSTSIESMETSKQGMGRLGHNASSNPRQTPICIGYSEIDKYAIQIYKNHYKGHKNYGNATKIIPEQLPDFDFLVGGFPCPSFSIAGKRKGFDDTRGALFFDIARILAYKRPRYLLLENVKGLLSHDSGKTLQTILRVLSDLGYGIEWQVLNSKNYRVPQNRERIFIFGTRGGSGRKIFPIREQDNQDGDKVREEQEGRAWVSTLDSRYGERWSTETYVRQPLKFLERNQKNISGDYSFTVDASQTSGVALGSRIRRLTPIECERLQSFPDNFTKYGINNNEKTVEISDSQRYKCLGNSITVNVIEAIMEKFIEVFEKEGGERIDD